MWLLKVKLVIIILLSSIFSSFTSFLGSMPCKVMETVFCLNVYVLGSFRLKLLWPLLHYRWTYYYEILFGVLHILKTLVVLMLVSMSLNCEQRTNLQINLSTISQKGSFFFFISVRWFIKTLQQTRDRKLIEEQSHTITHPVRTMCLKIALYLLQKGFFHLNTFSTF